VSLELSVRDEWRVSERLVCPACWRETAEALTPRGQLPETLRALIAANAPAQVENICGRCVRLFERAKAQMDAYGLAAEAQALPTHLRLDADERFQGRGVTIAFLDSGFYPHADLTAPRNRIVAYHNIFDPEGGAASLHLPDPASWHGMMTSVVAAGNGSLSDGFYRGLAPEADVVLVKIGKSGAIPEENIQKGLDWVRENREKYDIRVVNMSVGGDWEASYLNNKLAQTVEQMVAEGLVVVCAVGNAGHTPRHAVLPPACAPSVITVGGLDDHNSLDRQQRGMYRSSYGPTVDGLQKPEIIAPGIWVPAPILPHTPTAKQAELLHLLDKAESADLGYLIKRHEGVDRELDEARHLPDYLLRQLITLKIRETSVINNAYKYVDGTSFAAPIVSSLAACMLEANPKLSPQRVKRLLIDTAERLPLIEVDRQGWGVITPRKALEAALNEEKKMKNG
jgi:serine protease AprX